MASDRVKIFVRCAINSMFDSIAFSCKTTDTVADLADQFKVHSSVFGVMADAIKKECFEIFQYRMSDSEKVVLKWSDRVCDLERSIVEVRHRDRTVFDIEVHDVISSEHVHVRCKDNDSLHTVISRVKDKCVVGEHGRASRSVDVSTNEFELELILLKRSTISTNKYVLIQSVADIPKNGQDKIFFHLRTVNIQTCQSLQYTLIDVSHVSSGRIVQMLFSDKDSILDVVERIRARLDDFHLSSRDLESINTLGNEITVFNRGRGRGSLLEYTQLIERVEDQKLYFNVSTKTMRVTTIADVTSKLDGQRIAFFGAPGHGKSSTINSIVTALSGVYQPLAQTWQGAATGTAVISTYDIKLLDKTFTCIDVPGKGLQQLTSKGSSGHSSSVIGWILDGKFPKDQKLDYWSLSSLRSISTYIASPKTGRIQVVLIVHKGTATFDKLCNAVIHEARNRGIPIFVIITHIDGMDNTEVQNAVTAISTGNDISRGRIFTIANYGYGDDETIDDSRKHYIMSFLLKIFTQK
ncbi:uncharacterized protein LOC144444210 [Glandiceps talaboti]